MFCGLCYMSPQPTTVSPSQAPGRPDPGHKLQTAPQQGARRPAPLLLHGFAGFQGWASEPEGLVPAPPSRGEKAGVRAGKRVPCGAGSGPEESRHAALGVQIQQGARKKPQSSCRQMCILFSRDSTSPRTLPNPCSGPLG